MSLSLSLALVLSCSLSLNGGCCFGANKDACVRLLLLRESPSLISSLLQHFPIPPSPKMVPTIELCDSPALSRQLALSDLGRILQTSHTHTHICTGTREQS
uniref:Putative secreted protein n=1 Tax=Anopheles darlingi TaxID=43151 RepID=A0A2M4DNH4_ANODA